MALISTCCMLCLHVITAIIVLIIVINGSLSYGLSNIYIEALVSSFGCDTTKLMSCVVATLSALTTPSPAKEIVLLSFETQSAYTCSSLGESYKEYMKQPFRCLPLCSHSCSHTHTAHRRKKVCGLQNMGCFNKVWAHIHSPKTSYTSSHPFSLGCDHYQYINAIKTRLYNGSLSLHLSHVQYTSIQCSWPS